MGFAVDELCLADFFDLIVVQVHVVVQRDGLGEFGVLWCWFQQCNVEYGVDSHIFG
jgi:hypothetical protein